MLRGWHFSARACTLPSILRLVCGDVVRSAPQPAFSPRVHILARLFRKITTKKIPEGASIVTVRGEKVARWTSKRGKKKGKEYSAPLNKKGTGILVYSKLWHGEWIDADGNTQSEALAANKDAAQIMLNEKVREAEMGRAGIRNPCGDHGRRPLREHLAEWEADLKAQGSSAKHVAQTVSGARRILDGCGFTFFADVEAPPIQALLARLRNTGETASPLDPVKASYTRKEACEALGMKPPAFTSLVTRHRLEATGNGKARRYPKATVEALMEHRGKGCSVKTSNLYLAAVKQFLYWMVENKRAPASPITHLRGGNVKTDRRHDRRALPAEALRQILDAALASTVTFRGLTGRDRHHIYLTAMITGYRAEELANLLPESFDLDARVPMAMLPARLTKNGETAVQPLPPDVAAALREYLKDKPAGEPVWPGLWYTRAADMLRIELDACGIPYVVHGLDGPLFADFHALRHSFIILLDQSGASVKQAMTLARHSDPKLTMAIYGKL